MTNIADQKSNSAATRRQPGVVPAEQVPPVDKATVGSVDLSSVTAEQLGSNLTVNGSIIPLEGRDTPQGVADQINTLGSRHGMKASINGEGQLVLTSLDARNPIDRSDDLKAFEAAMLQPRPAPVSPRA